ncbi:MAG: methyl-accepting chemotaxis protein [Spirochaetales bacterium]|nr:methyl-accepting chemotaxis protein [Spirochaetales bacterium]
MKLRMRFVLPLSILVTAGLIVVSFVLYKSAKNELQSSAIGQMEQVSEALVHSADYYHKVLKSDIKNFASSSKFEAFLESGSHEDLLSCNDRLKQYKADNSSYENIVLLDLSGEVIASSTESIIGKVNCSDRDYFKEALKGHSYIGDAIRSKVSGNPTNTVSYPVKSGNKIIGVLIVVADLTNFSDQFISPLHIGDKGYVYMCDNNGLVISHPDESGILEVNLNDYDFGKHIMSEKDGVYNYTFKGVSKIAVYRATTKKGWEVIATASTSDIFSGVNNVLKFTTIIGVVVLLVMISIIWFLVSSVVNPIKKAADDAEKIAGGDLTIKIYEKNLKRADEIGTLAKAFNDMLLKLREVVFEVRTSSETVFQSSEQLTATAEELSQGSTEQAATSEEVSSSMEEMSSTIQQNAENSRQTETMAKQASVDADDGGAAVVDTVEAMRAISEKVKIIDDIARNTNILSLNASIEAARAGEHGTGFAVVATEVGKLAAHSQDAAQEIFELASSSVGKAEKAGELISKVVSGIQNTADLVEEISASSLEQNAGVSQINKALLQLDQAIQSNVSSAEETSSMAEELSSQAESLSEAIDFFKLDEHVNVWDSVKKDPAKTNSKTKKALSLPDISPDSDTSDEDFEAF